MTNVRKLAKALDQGVTYLSGREDPESDIAGYSTADYTSELMSDFGSEDERSKYGINALRGPIF